MGKTLLNAADNVRKCFGVEWLIFIFILGIFYFYFFAIFKNVVFNHEL